MINIYKNIAYFILFLMPASAFSAEFSIIVKSTAGKAIKDAAVTLTPTKKRKLKTGKTYIIDQINKTYVPHVTIIPAGSNISFPNKDNIRHHVYSFSETKKFELPLYEGTPTKPITFNKSGIAVLGCNIHDWMRAYIFISDTPYYGLSGDSGSIIIKNVPKGKYSLRIWHPRLKSYSQSNGTKIKVTAKQSSAYLATVSLKPAFKIRRAPKAKRRRY